MLQVSSRQTAMWSLAASKKLDATSGEGTDALPSTEEWRSGTVQSSCSRCLLGGRQMNWGRGRETHVLENRPAILRYCDDRSVHHELARVELEIERQLLPLNEFIQASDVLHANCCQFARCQASFIENEDGARGQLKWRRYQSFVLVVLPRHERPVVELFDRQGEQTHFRAERRDRFPEELSHRLVGKREIQRELPDGHRVPSHMNTRDERQQNVLGSENVSTHCRTEVLDDVLPHCRSH